MSLLSPAWQAFLARAQHQPMDLMDTALKLAALDGPEPAEADAAAMIYNQLLAAARPLADLSTSQERAAALSQLLAESYRFAGDVDDYDAAENANLIHVLNRRRGLPVALSVIYLSVAEALGWAAYGLNFPGHFILAIEGADGQTSTVVDPFRDGRILTTHDLADLARRMLGPKAQLKEEMLRPLSSAEVLARLVNNLKVRAVKAGKGEEGLEYMRRIAALCPRDLGILTEFAQMLADEGHMCDACDVLEKVESLASGEVAEDAAVARNKLRRALN